MSQAGFGFSNSSPPLGKLRAKLLDGSLECALTAGAAESLHERRNAARGRFVLRHVHRAQSEVDRKLDVDAVRRVDKEIRMLLDRSVNDDRTGAIRARHAVAHFGILPGDDDRCKRHAVPMELEVALAPVDGLKNHSRNGSSIDAD